MAKSKDHIDYTRKKKLEDWVDDISKTIHYIFPKIVGDDYDEIRQEVFLKLAKYNFPNCVRGWPDHAPPRSAYNYMYTCIRRCHYDYTNKMKRHYHYIVDDFDSISEQYYFDDVDTFKVMYDRLPGAEKHMVLEILDTKKNINKLYQPWQIQSLTYNLGISSIYNPDCVGISSSMTF